MALSRPYFRKHGKFSGNIDMFLTAEAKVWSVSFLEEKSMLFRSKILSGKQLIVIGEPNIIMHYSKY